VDSTKRARLLTGAALVAALGLAASGCGGSSGNDTTTTTTSASATVQWASAVCTAFSSWKASLQRAKASLSSQPTTTEFQNASQQVEVSTQGLQSSLQQLGRPPTETNASVQKSISTLRTELLNGKQQIQKTLNGSFTSKSELQAGVASVKSTATSMLNAFSSTISDLKSLDPGSELEKAFHQTSACDPFFT
jgi:small-conductance mechanosensitive channel